MELLKRQIEDVYTRENFDRIEKALSRGSPFDNFTLIEIDAAGAVSHAKLQHGLGYTPLDILVTFTEGAGTIGWHRDEFDHTYIDYSTTGAVRVRALVGTFKRANAGRAI